MVPASFQLPAALVLIVGGAVACFFGFRLFRIVLALFGFIAGASLASSVSGLSTTTWMIGAALLGGLIGAALLYAAYFVGVALGGATLGAVAANAAFSVTGQDPHYLVVVFAAVAGAALATYLQRYFIIVATAFGGAWTLMVGAMALVGDAAAMRAAASGNVWVVYPLDPAPGRGWVPLAWLALGAIGAMVQLGWTGGDKGRVVKRKAKKV